MSELSQCDVRQRLSLQNHSAGLECPQWVAEKLARHWEVLVRAVLDMAWREYI